MIFAATSLLVGIGAANAGFSVDGYRWATRFNDNTSASGNSQPLTADDLINYTACTEQNRLNGHCRHEIGAPFIFVNPIKGTDKLLSGEEYYVVGLSKVIGCMNASMDTNIYLWNNAPGTVSNSVYNDSDFSNNIKNKGEVIGKPITTSLDIMQTKSGHIADQKIHTPSVFSEVFEFGPYIAPNKIQKYEKNIFIVSAKVLLAYGDDLRQAWINYGRTSGFINFEVNACKAGEYKNSKNECVACPSGTPKWNSTTNQCEACPSNTQWNSTTNQCQCSNGLNNPPTCSGNTCSSADQIFYNNQCNNDACTNIDGTQKLGSLPSKIQYDGNGQCSCNNGATNPNGGCNNCKYGTNPDGTCVALPPEPDVLIDSFLTQPSSRLINKGSTCKIDWTINPLAIEFFESLNCTVNPGNITQNNISQTGFFESPILNNTITYTMSCIGVRGDITKTESKSATCNVVPDVMER